MSSLRVAFHTDNGIVSPTPESQDAVRTAAAALADARAAVTESTPAFIERTGEIINGIWFAHGGAAISRMLEQWGTTETSLAGRIGNPPLSAGAVDRVFSAWYECRSGMTAFFEDYDVILAPVNAGPAPDHGNSPRENFTYTQSYNLTGWPGAVVRGGSSPDGMPIGVQVVAHPAREDVALAVANVLEESWGGFQPPSI